MHKTSKPSKSCKAGHTVSVQIQKNIPFDKAAVITCTQVTHKVKKRVVAKSTKFAIPIIPSTHLPKPPDSPPIKYNNPQLPDKQTHKGPSRLVVVCSLFYLLYSMNWLSHEQSNLEQWLQYRDKFANKFIKQEVLYLGDKPSPCQDCGVPEALFCCLDCFAFGLACQDCVIHQHIHQIFHWLQVSFYLLSHIAPNSNVHRSGMVCSLTIPLSLNQTHCINSVTVSVTPALSHPNPLISPCLIFPVSIWCRSCTAFVETPG